MVGTNTAIIDNPQLTNRFYGKKQPVRVLIDRHHRVPPEALIFSDPTKPIHLFCGASEIKPNYPDHISLHPLAVDNSFLTQLLAILKQEGITSLLVEGGATTIQHFIDENLWDEAYVSLSQLDLHHGIKAPLIPMEPFDSYEITNDRYFWYLNNNGIKRTEDALISG
jgi:diaminohydroxyphosphoribosylaminopyrimidine deaminase/5-amino-6-(5-phosphoribosylamino)uracil reductase